MNGGEREGDAKCVWGTGGCYEWGEGMLRVGRGGMLIQIQAPPEPPEILLIFWLLAPRKQERQAGSQRGPLSLRQWLRWVIGGWPAPQSSRGTGETWEGLSSL